MTDIRNVCVIGAGTLGARIALQSAMYGFDVTMVDCSQDLLDQAARLQASEGIDEHFADGLATVADRKQVLGRISLATSLEDAAARADIVIEAVTEDVAVKRQVFAALDSAAPPPVILATNSSSIPISMIESSVRRLDRVLNSHFVQERWRLVFVELMRGSQTSDATIRVMRDFAESIHVIPFALHKEHMGFIFNRIWRVIKKEVLRMLDEDVTSAADIDRTWMLKYRTSYGPCAMMDAVGLDVVRDIENVYADASGDPADRPPQLVHDMIARGELGAKSGKGFYTYPSPLFEQPGFLDGSMGSSQDDRARTADSGDSAAAQPAAAGLE